MNETYVECMIKRKPNLIMKVVKVFSLMVTILLVLVGMLGNLLFLIAGIVFAVVTYFAGLHTEIEYEYLYVDRQLSIDKVLNRTRRKKIVAYDLGRMEILAPINSYQLDKFKNRTAEIKDFSSGIIGKPDTRFVMFYNGTTKVIFEPNIEMVKAMAMVEPRKVFKE